MIDAIGRHRFASYDAEHMPDLCGFDLRTDEEKAPGEEHDPIPTYCLRRRSDPIHSPGGE